MRPLLLLLLATVVFADGPKDNVAEA
ncbi:MAG: hypothetical protein RL759_1681, partial [Verrucomicrobiota bacterium]